MKATDHQSNVSYMPATLLVAAHGTRSADGAATTRALVDAVSAARPAVPVSLCFLDVASPSLPDALDDLAGTDVVVVPLLLSAGYHVHTDIPSIVSGRPAVRVTAHLGPDRLVVSAVASRLREAGGDPAASVLLAAIGSTRPAARAEVSAAARLLADELSRPVDVLPLGPDVEAALERRSKPVAVATYLLAEGGFLDALRSAVGSAGVVADPIGVHSALVTLVWARYGAACG